MTRSFESDIEALFDATPAFDDDAAFAGAVVRRLRRRRLARAAAMSGAILAAAWLSFPAVMRLAAEASVLRLGGGVWGASPDLTTALGWTAVGLAGALLVGLDGLRRGVRY